MRTLFIFRVFQSISLSISKICPGEWHVNYKCISTYILCIFWLWIFSKSCKVSKLVKVNSNLWSSVLLQSVCKILYIIGTNHCTKGHSKLISIKRSLVDSGCFILQSWICNKEWLFHQLTLLTCRYQYWQIVFQI